MSVIVTVAAAGTVVVASPILAGLAAAAAASMGLRLVDAAQRAQERAEAQEREEQSQAARQVLDISIATEAALRDVVAERCQLSFTGDQLQVLITRDIRGKLTVTAESAHLERAELTERAEQLLGRIRQQIAYRDVVERMTAQGFELSQEQALEDGTVRVRLRVKKP